MKNFLSLENLCGINPHFWYTLSLALFAVCLMAVVMVSVFITSRRFIDRELNILYSKKYNCFDKLMVVVASTLLTTLLIGLCAFGLGTILRTYLFNIDIHYERLMVTYATVLTLIYSLVMPNHSKLRLFKISDEHATEICRIASRVIIVSFCIVSFGVILTNLTGGEKIVRIEEIILSVIACEYYFFELSANRKLITSSFIITNTAEYSIAAKLTTFISNKFVFIAVAGMVGVMISDYGLSKTPVHFYENLSNIYQFMLLLYLLQLGLSCIINKFVERVQKLEKSEVSRKKNLIWICDVTVMMTYVIIACFILKCIGMNVMNYLFHSKVIGSILIIFVALVVQRAFQEFMGAYSKGNFKSFVPLLSIIFNFLLLTVTGMIILENLGIGIAPVLTMFAAIGGTIAFAAKSTLESFIQGIMLLFEKDLLIGDYVTVNGVSGTVESLSIRIVTLRCVDGSVRIIPYNQVSTITNFSRGYNVARDVLRICDPKDIPEAMRMLAETSAEIVSQEKYKNKIYGQIDIDGIESYNGNGIEIKWSIMTASALVSLYFKDELYMKMSQLLRSKEIQIPVGRIYKQLTD